MGQYNKPFSKKKEKKLTKGKNILSHKADADGVNADGKRATFNKEKKRIVTPTRLVRQQKQGMY